MGKIAQLVSQDTELRVTRHVIGRSVQYIGSQRLVTVRKGRFGRLTRSRSRWTKGTPWGTTARTARQLTDYATRNYGWTKV